MCYMIVPLRELRARETERISIRMVLGCESVDVLRMYMNVCTNFKAYAFDAALSWISDFTAWAESYYL